MKRRAIVVGVSRSTSSWDALVWAAAEAYDRCRALRIVHVVRCPALTFNASGVLPVDLVGAALSAGELFVDEAKNQALSIAPALRIDTVVQLGEPSSAILRAGGTATMIVLGRRHSRRLPRPFVSSTAARVARRAECPVAVVGLHDDVAGPSAARVVALLDGGVESVRTLDFAFDAAQRRGVGVTVLLSSDTAADPTRKYLAHRLPEWHRHAFPGVDVCEKVLAEPIGPALVAEARGAAVVAVSESARRQVRQALLEPPATSVVGPVVLVRMRVIGSPTPQPSTVSRINRE